MKKLYLVVAILLAISLLCVYYFFNPAKYGFFPQCPFHQLTGLDCPGCGSQRACNRLLHGDIEQAIHYNFLLVLSLPFLLIHFGYKLLSLITKKDLKWVVVYHPVTPKIILFAVLLFFALRNIPAYPFIYLKV